MPTDFNLLKTFAGHSRDVNSVEFSRDDALIVSGGGDRTVQIWNAATYELLHTMEHGDWVNGAAFAPSAQFVASAARDGSIKVWNVEKGQLLGSIQSHPNNATCVTFSHDGSWIVSGGAEGVIRVFNLKAKKFEGGVSAHTGWVWRVAFSSKGDRLVSAGADRMARLWRMGSNEQPVNLEGHQDEVLYASFSPDDCHVATASKDGTVRLWETASGREVLKIQAHEGAVNAVNFSPDGMHLISAGADHFVRLWSAQTGEKVRELSGGYDYMAEAVFSHDGTRMASCGGDGAVKLWEVAEKAAYAAASIDSELEIELEETGPRGGYSSAYAAGKTLIDYILKSGLKISMLQAGPEKYAVAAGANSRTAVSISGDELTVLSGEGIPLLKLDLSNYSVAFDKTEGAAAPWNSEGGLTLSASAGPSPLTTEPNGTNSVSDEFELSDDTRPSRYHAFEKHGESLIREKTGSGRLIRLVRVDADTLFLLFDQKDDPTLIIKADNLDVYNGSRNAVFKLDLREMAPVISRRSAQESAQADSAEAETVRDPLFVAGAEALTTSATSGPRLHRILSKAVWAKASDIHVPSGAPILLRRHGRLEPLDDLRFEPSEVESMLLEVLTDEQRSRFIQTNDLDFSYEIAGVGRFRANLCRQHRGIDGSFRIIPDSIPSPEALGLPPAVLSLTKHHQGLVLVTGPAGQGKSTTIATLVDQINNEKPVHIITIEDPIEFVHPIKRAVVNQREVGKHTQSFGNALRAALREDPDVIVVGEMRDLETISLAITAAETGHLVFGSLMTVSAAQTVDRILDSFPAGQQAQIRTMLSESLKGIVSQQLVPLADGTGRALAAEVLLCNLAVANMIRERKTFQISSILQTSRNQGMQRMDDALFDLFQASSISAETAAIYAHDPKAMESRVKPRAGTEVAAPKSR